jgi:hypothetical protein
VVPQSRLFGSVDLTAVPKAAMTKTPLFRLEPGLEVSILSSADAIESVVKAGRWTLIIGLRGSPVTIVSDSPVGADSAAIQTRR